MKYSLLILVLLSIAACSTSKPTASHLQSENGILTTDNYADIENRLSNSPDTLYIVNYWATWCKPCVDEMPYLVEYAAKTKNTNQKLILVSLDWPGQQEKKLIPFLREQNIQSEVWHMTNMDYNTWLDEVDPSWSGSIPATQLRFQGKKLFTEESFHSVAEIETYVDKIR